MDPSIQITPALGPKVCKYNLHLAAWILRVGAFATGGSSFLGRPHRLLAWPPPNWGAPREIQIQLTLFSGLPNELPKLTPFLV